MAGWMALAGATSVVALAWYLTPEPADAETLADALAAAYMNNPTLQAARAQQRQTDEQVPQALSNWRPTVSIDGEVGAAWEETIIDGANNNTATRAPKSVALGVIQPIYRGGRTVAQRDQAENIVAAGRAQLLSTEQRVLLDAVTAYVNVLRDLAVLDLTRNNEKVIGEQLKSTRERFDVGEVTRTDVSQAEARLALATADRIQAEGNLVSSRATYLQVIGAPPVDLVVPELPEALP